MVEAVS